MEGLVDPEVVLFHGYVGGGKVRDNTLLYAPGAARGKEGEGEGGAVLASPGREGSPEGFRRDSAS